MTILWQHNKIRGDLKYNPPSIKKKKVTLKINLYEKYYYY